MPRDTPPPPLPRHQRADGAFELTFGAGGPRGGGPALRHLFQQAPLRALFPTPEPGEPPLAAVVNCAGGLAGGDALRQEVRLDAGARAVLVGESLMRQPDVGAALAELRGVTPRSA